MPDAVGQERVSKTVGYIITKGNFSEQSRNLPQRIAIIGEANYANQGTLDTDAKEVTSAKQAGELYGYGSPIHMIMRILRPDTNSGVGGIPTIVYPQAQASGATSKVMKITPSGVATGNGTHSVVIAGRYGIDGANYDIAIEEGDTTADICAKIADAVNNVLGAPVVATDYDYDCRLESKWKGLTANDLNVTVDNNGNDLGISYATSNIQAAIQTPSIAAALAQFGNEWNTIVVNSYGTVTAIMNALEAYNGIPDPEIPTGRYAGIVMKPFIALTGSIEEDPSSITDSRKDQVTISICPAPLSTGMQFEAAANVCFNFARQAQDNPNLDISGKTYPDMPTPTSIGAMSDYSNRDTIVKKGCSTVDLLTSKYVMMDFVTTYHPVGEIPPQFRYCRNLNIDWNVRFGYYLLEQINVVDHSISNDDDVVNAANNVIKPKQWRQIVGQYADDLANRALIADAAFMQDSITVNISTTNPDRLETFFRYKRTGYVRIASTEAQAGFNFGTN